MAERGAHQVVYGDAGFCSRRRGSGSSSGLQRMFCLAIHKLSDVAIPLDTVATFDCWMHASSERFGGLPGTRIDCCEVCQRAKIGFTQIGLRYRRSSRYAGVTKYPLNKMLGLAVDGVVSFSIVPLRVVTAIGFLSAAIAFVGILYSLIVRIFTHSWVRGWALSFIGMLFMSGVQLLCLGVLGEYIGRIYTESKQRPLFILRERSPRESNPARAEIELRDSLVESDKISNAS